jgi:hypothetical protein
MVSPDRISYLFWIIYFFREHTKVCLIFIEGRIMNTRRLQLAADNERRQTPLRLVLRQPPPTPQIQSKKVCPRLNTNTASRPTPVTSEEQQLPLASLVNTPSTFDAEKEVASEW